MPSGREAPEPIPGCGRPLRPVLPAEGRGVEEKQEPQQDPHFPSTSSRTALARATWTMTSKRRASLARASRPEGVTA